MELEFANHVYLLGIEIYETYHPGAVVKISCKDMRGQWIVVYEGAPQQSKLPHASRIFKPALAKTLITREVRIDMNTRDSASWSEIDAVKVIGIQTSEQVNDLLMHDMKDLLISANPNLFESASPVLGSDDCGCDLTWNTTSGHSFKLHSFLIEQRCPTLLKNCSNSVITTNDDHSKDVFRCFLEYIYTDGIIIPNEQQASAAMFNSLVTLANAYQVERLIKIASYVPIFDPDMKAVNYVIPPLGGIVKSSMKADMNKALASCKQVPLITSNGTIYAHKCMLVLRWTYFKTLFAHWKNEDIVLETITLEVLQHLLEYVYAGETSITLENAVDLFVSANEYLLDDKFKEVTQFLISTIASENVLDLLHLAHNYNSEELLESCFQFLEQNPQIMRVTMRSMLQAKKKK